MSDMSYQISDGTTLKIHIMCLICGRLVSRRVFSKERINVTCMYILNCQGNHIVFLLSDFNPAKTAGLDSDSCLAFSDLEGDLSGGYCRSR